MRLALGIDRGIAPVALHRRSINTIKVGMRVQSFSARDNGKILLVDTESNTVWIKWGSQGAASPYPCERLTDIYSIDG